MSIDPELQTWRLQWYAEGVVPADLVKRAEAQQRYTRVWLVLETLVTIGVGGVFTGWAMLSPEPDIIVLAAVTWVALAAAWAFRFLNLRGRWAPAALDTTSYVGFLVERCKAQLQATRFGMVLYTFNIVFSVSWIFFHNRYEGWNGLFDLLFGSVVIGLVWLATAIFFVICALYRIKKRAELACLRELQQQFSANGNEY